MQIQRSSPRAVRVFRIAILIAVVIVSGCGLAEYEERLRATSEFNEYIQTIEANLVAPIWENGGIKMRLPLPFDEQMAPPPIVENEDGEKVYGPDSRHPQILGIMLPGIVDAWRATLPGDGGGEVDSRIYVLSNQYRFRKVDGAYVEDPTQFFYDVEAALALAFNVIIPEGEANAPADNIRYRVTFPPQKSLARRFSTPKDYSAIRFVSSEPIAEQKLQAQLYEYSDVDLQVAVLVVGPQAFTPRFQQRLDLALQTLTIDKDAPADGSPTGRKRGGNLGF